MYYCVAAEFWSPPLTQSDMKVLASFSLSLLIKSCCTSVLGNPAFFNLYRKDNRLSAYLTHWVLYANILIKINSCMTVYPIKMGILMKFLQGNINIVHGINCIHISSKINLRFNFLLSYFLIELLGCYM